MEKLGKKLKHDHTLTSILKFTIFAMVMLAPIFSVASRCLYVICNKNAKDSYSNQQISKYNRVNNDNELLENYEYTLNAVNTSVDAFTYKFTFTTCNLDFATIIPQTSGINIVAFALRVPVSGNKFLMAYDSDGISYENHSGNVQFILDLLPITFTLKSYTSIGYTNNFSNYTLNQIVYTTDKLDNAFEYSLSQLEESSYYNWATNLGIYTPINNMVSGLGGHSIISLLLAYWSIYTAIYIVFDIIIACFVKITHMIQGE